MITFTVFGVAQPKGSTRAFVPKGWTRPIITSDNQKSKGWQQLVAEAASRALQGSGQLFHGSIKLDVAFHLPRPKSLPRTRETPMTKKPDCDKLLRSTVDALTGVIFRDDSQVVDVHVTKQYAALGESPRAIVTIEPLDVRERLFFESERIAPHEKAQSQSQTEEALVHPDRP